MKLSVEYISDSNGKVENVQLPITEWNKLISKFKKYEQERKLKSDLTVAFKQVAKMKKHIGETETLADFLNEL